MKHVASIVTIVLTLAVAGSFAAADVISTPDVQSFDTDGDPAAGWTNWAASGGVLLTEVSTYNVNTATRDGNYVYDSSKPLVIEFTAVPGMGGNGSSMGLVFLAPNSTAATFSGNQAAGYRLRIAYGASNQLQLERDYKQWQDGADYAGVDLDTADLPTGYGTAEATFRIEVSAPSGNTANFKVYYNDELKIDVDDTAFLPLAGWNSGATAQGAYTDWYLGFSTHMWPGYTQGSIDDFSVTQVVPEPATLALLGLGGLGMLAARRRR